MVGAISTYLIILLQNVNTNNCESHSISTNKTEECFCNYSSEEGIKTIQTTIGLD